MMKLYTEEQVRKAIELSRDTHQEGRAYMERDEYDYSMDEVVDLLTPIELPSDEEVDKMRKEYIEHVNTIVHRDLERDGYLDLGFLAGAKNIIDKIQGGNNEQQ